MRYKLLATVQAAVPLGWELRGVTACPAGKIQIRSEWLSRGWSTAGVFAAAPRFVCRVWSWLRGGRGGWFRGAGAMSWVGKLSCGSG